MSGAPRPPRSIALPRTLSGEFDPIGVVLELRQPLGLTDAQVRLLFERRRMLRLANRDRLARLDSLDAALRGDLTDWLATARGAERSPRLRIWQPKVPAPAHAVAVALLACIRGDARDAARDALAWLDEDQRWTLQRLARPNASAAAFEAVARGSLGHSLADTTGARLCDG